MRYPFCGQSYSPQSPFIAHERTLNFYPEVIESGSHAGRLALYPTPGFATFCTLGQSPVRGLFASNGRCFAISGAGFYEIYSDRTWYRHGTVRNDGKPVTFSSNGDAGGQLWITSGGHGYVFTLATNVLEVDVRRDSTMGGFVDGYFLNLDSTTSTLSLSSLENGLSWDAADVAQRSTTPDRWVSMLVSHQQIWLFGKTRTDVWYNTGGTFPFAPVSGTLIEHGIAAPASACIMDNTVFWLGANEQGTAMVWRANGYTPVRVSHHALEYAMQSYSRVDDAVAFAYQDQGHAFYVLTFPSATATSGATWVFDAATTLWHERGHWNAGTGLFERWMPACHCFAFDKYHLVGDYNGGGVFRMGIDQYTDADGSLIRRMRQAPHLIGDHQWLFYHRAELLLETGTGNYRVRNPRVALQWSDDAGLTWSSENWVNVGLAGQRQTRAVWRRLGQARNRIFRVVAEDGAPWRLLDLVVDVESGLH